MFFVRSVYEQHHFYSLTNFIIDKIKPGTFTAGIPNDVIAMAIRNTYMFP